MKTLIHYSLILALPAAPFVEGGDKLKGKNTVEKTIVVSQEPFPFPPKPAEIIKATFLVGPPDITIDANLAIKMGGLGINELVRTPIENLLHNSGRFRVSNKPGPYSVSANVSNFSISQINDKKNAAFGKLFKEIITRTARLDASDPLEGALSSVLDADWTRDELEMTILCAVTVQLRDHQGVLLAGQTGEVVRKDTTKNIRTELVGIQFSTGATRAGLVTDPSGQPGQLQSRIVELATIQAIRQLIPILDSTLAAGVITAIPPPEAGKAPDSDTARAESSLDIRPVATLKGAFCSKCGNKSVAGDNFCTKCGNKLTP